MEEKVITLQWNKNLGEWDVKPLYIALKQHFSVEVTRGLKGVFTSGTQSKESSLKLVMTDGHLFVKTSTLTDYETLLGETRTKIYSKVDKSGFKFTIGAMVTMINTYLEGQDGGLIS